MSSLSKCIKALIISSIVAFPAIGADNLGDKGPKRRPPPKYEHVPEKGPGYHKPSSRSRADLAANRTKDNRHLISGYMQKLILPIEVIEHILSFKHEGDWLDYILTFNYSISENIVRDCIEKSFESLIIKKRGGVINIKPLQNIYYLAPKFFDDDITYIVRNIIRNVLLKVTSPSFFWFVLI